MKIYKVYAQNVRVAKAISEITEQEAQQLISDMVYELLDLEEPLSDERFENKVNELYNKALQMFETKSSIDCGDFEIKKSEDIPARSNVCGYPEL